MEILRKIFWILKKNSRNSALQNSNDSVARPNLSSEVAAAEDGEENWGHFCKRVRQFFPEQGFVNLEALGERDANPVKVTQAIMDEVPLHEQQVF